MFFKKLLFLVFSSAMLVGASPLNSEKPVIWFDLGNVILDGSDVPRSFSFLPGAEEYLESLKEAGYEIGTIFNITDAFGPVGDQETRKRNTQKFIRERWRGPGEFGFDVFDYVILPLSTAERKPASALFLRALDVSRNSLYISEDKEEGHSALLAGMSYFAVETGSVTYPNISDINDLLPIWSIE